MVQLNAYQSERQCGARGDNRRSTTGINTIMMMSSFLCLRRQFLLIDLEDKTISIKSLGRLHHSQRRCHRTRALVKTVMLMVETSEIVPTGD